MVLLFFIIWQNIDDAPRRYAAVLLTFSGETNSVVRFLRAILT